MNVCPFIEAENTSATGNVKRACELLKLSRAANYAYRTRQPSTLARQDVCW
nr:hypothetical protein [Kibdelosporangium sp. MJ126-NF4]CEL23443.1 Mobile element protein [Kibdelosporangium sp. MJ126-NF4]CTQ96823.1 Mobile element protein [Kibdelosporangium sp. MJ126-NF4]